MSQELYTSVDQVMLWMKDKLTERTEFGFKYIDYGDPDDIIPATPAIVITNNPIRRELHGLHKFNVQLSIELWILHADGTIGAAQRRYDDILLCNQIQDFLDLNMNLPDEANLTEQDKLNNPVGNIIQGWISGQSPGILRRKGALFISTRMTWDGISQQMFV
jgi:hypothetical protein